ncbi:MAG: hypothetical protein A2261_01860 [Candidatus Magasanikbacteria bacterium RIFOXYA2_FULL_44_8]|uniref:Uncharacterized protein n=1 Tax=Candidatus Magasanikbacteria bacterium RIFOXYA2_FULL_44_8 TaxID=1798696 RepID=A0A1F6NL93_9BACT|nr:MAG: hypothetical protein A2261_01860 [Candidatus Magasanikbacteria bacterium RIFOXYA2_FULL_44_8]
MNESSYCHKPAIDEIILKHGPQRQERLGAIAKSLETKFNNPALFSAETQKELDLWAVENQD